MALQNAEFDWQELLLFIEQRKVIPVVGRELLVQDDRSRILLDQVIASRLAESLAVSSSSLMPGFSINDVALAYIGSGNARRKIYSKIKTLLDEQPPVVPEVLKKLAAIRHFRLFVSTTFDSLLQKALDEARYGMATKTRTLVFSTHSKADDLPCEIEDLHEAAVYQILGTLSPLPDYAVTEEDILEFIHKLQDPLAQPPRLFDAFKRSHLLILGCGFPDWLARFFLRTLSGRRLFKQRETSEYFADSQAGDPNLALFLRHCHTEIFLPGDPTDFITVLHQKWLERTAEVEDDSTAHSTAADRSSPSRKESAPVFLSYAKQDREMALRLSSLLRDAGIEIWVDSYLKSGVAWDREIRERIGGCLLFFPLVSANSRQRLEGYFRKEWRWALERAEGIDDSVPFIQPILLDDTKEGDGGTPAYFWSRQCIRCPHGRPPPEFVTETKATVRELRLRKAGWA